VIVRGIERINLGSEESVAIMFVKIWKLAAEMASHAISRPITQFQFQLMTWALTGIVEASV
jgi:hypothetical protein